ncbi:MAG: hypothetical protein QXP42_05145, partial [Candidatus Micrarchaeia archaeon]
EEKAIHIALLIGQTHIYTKKPNRHMEGEKEIKEPKTTHERIQRLAVKPGEHYQKPSASLLHSLSIVAGNIKKELTVQFSGVSLIKSSYEDPQDQFRVTLIFERALREMNERAKEHEGDMRVFLYTKIAPYAIEKFKGDIDMLESAVNEFVASGEYTLENFKRIAELYSHRDEEEPTHTAL